MYMSNVENVGGNGEIDSLYKDISRIHCSADCGPAIQYSADCASLTAQAVASCSFQVAIRLHGGAQIRA